METEAGPICLVSNNIKLEVDRYIKQEPIEDSAGYYKIENENIVSDPVDYKLTDIVNESDRFVDKKVKLEYKATGTEGTNINVSDGNLKVEPVWLKQENIDIKSRKGEKLPEENKKLERFVERKQSRAEINAKMRRWTNTSVIRNYDSSTPQYFSKTELRAMISRIQVSGKKKYRCQVCQFITAHMWRMNRHMTLHQDPSEPETLQCHNCGFKAKSKHDLASHMSTHGPSQRPAYRCHYCSFFTNLRSRWQQHLKQHSAIATTYECYTCGFKACRKVTLIHHIVRHRPKNFKPKKLCTCEHCAYETKNSSLMSRHLETHREPLGCIHCEYKTKYGVTMRRHMLKVHNVQVGRREIDLINVLTEPVVVE